MISVHQVILEREKDNCQMKRALIYSSLSVLILLVYLSFDIYSYSKKSSRSKADAAVVLGASVWRDRPSPVFRERINHAIMLYQSGVVGKLIFTGGLAQGDKFAESEAAKQYAVAQGVLLGDILTEQRSHSTCENLLESRRIIQKNGFTKVLIVSDPMHMRRAMFLARQLEIPAQPSPTSTTLYQSFGLKVKFMFKELYHYLATMAGIESCITP